MEHYIGGALSGCVQALVGHPLDTIKTWQQNNTSFQSNFRNWKSLFRGVKYPLFGSTILNFLYFGIQDDCYNITQNYFLAGSLTGFITTPFTSWFELNKIRLQVIDKHSYHRFLGMGLTFMREVPAMGIYFGTYHYFMEKKQHPIISGGVAGLFSWITTYPIDTIKTRIQSDMAISIKQAIQQRNLFQGIIPCLSRCIMVNSLGFYVYHLFVNE